jgi:hypothetical protein
VVAALGTRDQQPHARAWVEAVAGAVGEGDPLEEDTLYQLESQANHAAWHTPPPSLSGDPLVELRWFWEHLHARYPENNRVATRFAEHLFFGGDETDRRRALAIYYEAVAREPQLFLILSADVHDYAREQGGEDWLAFLEARLRFYVDEWRRGEDEEMVHEELRDLGRTFAGDPVALARIRRILLDAGAPGEL